MAKKRIMSQYEKMTETPIGRLIIKLSVPAVISMLITNLYNLADTAFVGRFGNSASGAVGIVFGFMSIIQAVGFTFGQGAGSILSRALGKRDLDSASLHASIGFFASLFFGFLITVFGFLGLDEIVAFLGSTPTIAPFAKIYISYILIASPFMCASLTLNNFLRYEGKAALGMIGLMIGAILNMIGDPILMFGAGMGIAGAGLSTAISQITGFCILLSMFLRHKTESRISFRFAARVTPSILGNIIATGFPSLLRQGLNSLTTVLLNARCAVYGDEAIAAMSIVARIVFFAFSVALGVGQGFQPVSAFNYGAKKYTRLKKGFVFTVLASEGIIAVACLVLFFFPEPLIALFREDARVIEIGSRALRLQAVATLCLPFCMTVEMLYQSTGKKLGATLLSAIRSGLMFIPALFLLSYLRGLNGIQEAQPAALLLSFPLALPFVIRFWRKLPKESPPGSETR